MFVSQTCTKHLWQNCEHGTISRHSTVALPIGMSHHSQKQTKKKKTVRQKLKIIVKDLLGVLYNAVMINHAGHFYRLHSHPIRLHC